MSATLLGALLVLLLPGIPPARAPLPRLQEYAIDAGHSIVEFSIGFAFSRVKGRFTQARGTILYDSIAPSNSSISMVFETKSIDTGWPHRDEHLRTSDFFDVERFPTIEFQSEQLRQANGGWVADGALTMHGVTKRVAIPFRFARPPTRSGESRWMIINVEGTLRLARKDFGILGGDTFNSWFTKARSATMADSVDISLELEGWSADAASQRPPGVEAALERIRANGIAAQISRLADGKKKATAEQWPDYFYGADLVTRALVATDRVADALTLSRALVDLFPGSTGARALHGYVLSASGDLAGAEREYAMAKRDFQPPRLGPNEKFPQDDETWWRLDQLARTSLEWGRTREAVSLARLVAELYPSTPRAHTTFGLALAAAGETRAAAAQYAQALALDPRETRAMELRRRLR